METLGYYNGEFAPLDEMKVPMLDRGCYFGDGVYEATLVRNRIPFAMDEHLDRLYNSAALLKIEIPCKKAKIAEIIQELIEKLDSPDQFAYWQVTRGTAPRGHAFPGKEIKANLWVMLTPFAGLDTMYVPKKLITIEDTRFLHCNIKTLNLVPNVMANEYAKSQGCEEAIFHRGERVTEGSHTNISILKDGVFITAPTDHLILPGITRVHLIQQCKNNYIPVDETSFTVKEMMEADEIIFSSSGCFCSTAEMIDGVKVGGKAPDLLNTIRTAVVDEFYEKTGGK